MHSARFDWVGPGTMIGGRYRVEALLGEGGYGAVYVATQTNLERKVAVKLLHAEVLTKPRARERFEREARLTQQLTHPNVVRLFDFGMTEQQAQPFIVCELLEGRSVEDEIVRVGALPPARVLHIAQQMLKGLADAHQRGIIHRDIKPANIFLCDYAGEPDFVKILDFGIAAGPSSDKAAGLTQEGVSLGTPAYMSPEQVLDEPLDGRADLYSVGLVMAEMLQGVAVFRGTGPMDVALQQVTETAVPLSPAVTHGPLGQFLVRATQKDRGQRFGSALEMLEALRELSNLVADPAATRKKDPSGPPPGVPTHSPMPSGPLQRGSMQSWPMPSGPLQPMPSAFPLPSGVPVNVTMPSPQVRGATQPRYTALVVLAVAASAIACLVVAAVIFKMVGALDFGRAAGDGSAAAKTPVKGPDKPADDSEELMNRMLQEQLTEAFRGAMNGPAGGAPLPCKPLPPELLTFAVKGLTLATVLARLEAAGHACQGRVAMGPEFGTLVFTRQSGTGFQLFYASGANADQLRNVPNNSNVTDTATRRSFIVMAGDNKSESATKIGKVMLGQPP